MSWIPDDVLKAARSAMDNPFNQSVAWEGPLVDAIARAIMAERERCAKICEDHGHSNGRILGSHKHMAAAIRKGEA